MKRLWIIVAASMFGILCACGGHIAPSAYITEPESAFAIQEIPAEDISPSTASGSVERFEYETAAERKYALIYTPYGYDQEQQYNILYIMHGGGGSAESLFAGAGQSNDIKNAIDHLIARGEMEPMIIVCPTFYTEAHSSSSVRGSWDAVLEFPNELIHDLMPAVENTYSTFAESTDDAGFYSSRDHRAFGGFSMGSVTTWYVFQQYMRYFSTFIPISGDSWTIEMQGGRSHPEKTAQVLANSVGEQGFSSDDFRIYALTGTNDIAEPCMSPMVEAMRSHMEIFTVSDSFSSGNTVYQIKPEGAHNMTYVKEYLYHALPILYGRAE